MKVGPEGLLGMKMAHTGLGVAITKVEEDGDISGMDWAHIAGKVAIAHVDDITALAAQLNAGK